MAFLYDHTVEELTASTWKKVAIGVLLTLIFHLGDALLGGHLTKNYKINAAEIGKVNHLPFCFYKMAKPPHSPIIHPRQMQCLAIRFSEWQMANVKTIVA
jgi:hypothetical protein